ncbi:MAG: hypothetical protein JWQ65_316, partial [Devosia sp.]|nr:hypothetical protein [Devosia sp.]
AGGALGTVYVTSSVFLTPMIGATAVMGLAIAGQLLAGLTLDRVGAAGAALLVAGAIMIRVL